MRRQTDRNAHDLSSEAVSRGWVPVWLCRPGRISRRRLVRLFVLLAVFGMGLPLMKKLLQSITVSARELPSPTGPFAVRRLSYVVDGQVHENGRPLKIAIDLWHPAEKSGNRPPPVSKHPLIVYAPGWNGRRNDNQLLISQLVSWGYVVTAIDDVGATAEPADKAAYGDFDLSSEEAMQRSLRFADTRLAAMVRRISAVLDRLEAADSPLPEALRRQIEFGRVGALGFSFGGSVAAEAAVLEPRIVAAVNMDGWHFGRSAIDGVRKPYLVFNSDYKLEEEIESRSTGKRLTAEITRADRNLQHRLGEIGSTTALLFSETRHDDFTDSLFAPSLATYIRTWRRDDADRLRLHRAISSHVLTFFDRTLMRPTNPKPDAPNQWPVIPLPRVVNQPKPK